MSGIRIASKSIDDLNLIYKKIKKDFQALGSIKLNHEKLEYELHLNRVELDGYLKAICDKVIDTDDLMDGESVFQEFTINAFMAMMTPDQVAIPLRPLKTVWADLTKEKQQACFNYFCEEIELNGEETVF